MKNPIASVGVAAVLAAGLILAPGLSPAQASTPNTSNTTIAMKPGNVATTYGMWFVPCNVFGFRMC
ncbi:hypothetical protein [Arthrobacter antibioticus]|uniref:hypothetical protein n=1 Tax=Arthrobacter sp. H35-MC1 TaxID=3046203 RepID=UPI0024BA18A5|nr:hypothetical protein [Arthrobacter sp. H35-MC1]MDJ0316678.1 hypothetical protein [Arthrobacter sp. H35-MC1]